MTPTPMTGRSAAVALVSLAALAGDLPVVRGSRRAGPRGVPAPVGPKPAAGRNDPCPCGSGKKFKRCHG